MISETGKDESSKAHPTFSIRFWGLMLFNRVGLPPNESLNIYLPNTENSPGPQQHNGGFVIQKGIHNHPTGLIDTTKSKIAIDSGIAGGTFTGAFTHMLPVTHLNSTAGVALKTGLNNDKGNWLHSRLTMPSGQITEILGPCSYKWPDSTLAQATAGVQIDTAFNNSITITQDHWLSGQTSVYTVSPQANVIELLVFYRPATASIPVPGNIHHWAHFDQLVQNINVDHPYVQSCPPSLGILLPSGSLCPPGKLP